MQKRGWIVRNTIIWQKPNATPTSAKDRFTVDFEYLFFFSKNKKYYFEQPKRNFTHNKNAEYKGYGKEQQCKFHQKILNNELAGRNMRSVWSIATVGFHDAHFATYPPKLIEIPIKAGCPEGGIVLDPFFGSGTTGYVAQKLNRKWLGIELNAEYIQIAEKRIVE